VTDLPHLSGKWGRLLLNMPLVKIGKAAGLLGVSVQTLRKLEDSGQLVSDRRSEGGVRYYDMGKNPRATEVSLRRQKHCLELVPALKKVLANSEPYPVCLDQCLVQAELGFAPDRGIHAP